MDESNDELKIKTDTEVIKDQEEQFGDDPESKEKTVHECELKESTDHEPELNESQNENSVCEKVESIEILLDSMQLTLKQIQDLEYSEISKLRTLKSGKLNSSSCVREDEIIVSAENKKLSSEDGKESSDQSKSTMISKLKMLVIEKKKQIAELNSSIRKKDDDFSKLMEIAKKTQSELKLLKKTWLVSAVESSPFILNSHAIQRNWEDCVLPIATQLCIVSSQMNDLQKERDWLKSELYNRESYKQSETLSSNTAEYEEKLKFYCEETGYLKQKLSETEKKLTDCRQEMELCESQKVEVREKLEKLSKSFELHKKSSVLTIKQLQERYDHQKSLVSELITKHENEKLRLIDQYKVQISLNESRVKESECILAADTVNTECEDKLINDKIKCSSSNATTQNIDQTRVDNFLEQILNSSMQSLDDQSAISIGSNNILDSASSAEMDLVKSQNTQLKAEVASLENDNLLLLEQLQFLKNELKRLEASPK